MKILYIYRNKNLGPSIRRVFEPIEKQMRLSEDVDSVYLPHDRANLNGLLGNILFVKKSINNQKYDIIHITGDAYYLAWILPHKKTVITVHDLGFFVGREHSLKSLLLWLIWIFPLKFAGQTTFISQKSLLEARKLVRLDSTKVNVIHNPLNENYSYSPKTVKTEKPVILHIGTKDNKNLERVACALNGISCKLHIIGKLTDSQKEKLANNNIEYYSESNISDQAIIDAYKDCDIVSFPSLYEGFGMPIIEGQAIGRPVVTSNISPMKEIAGDAAILVDPYCVDSIRNGFLESLNNYENIVESGLLNSRRFSLKQIVSQYKQVYEKTINS